MKHIFLNDGSSLTVDEEDYYWLVGFNWSTKYCSNNRVYGIRTEYFKKSKTQVYLHREVAKRKGLDIIGKEVDHINRDTRDCTRLNLRIANNIQNAYNSKLYSNNTSGARGVSFDKNSGKYKVTINVMGVQYHIGLYSTFDEAALAFEVNARYYHKDFIGQLKKDH